MVHFAGTATSVEWCGYMSGAVQSGYRAAAEILQDLQSTALKAEDLSLIEKAHPMASSWEEHLLTMFSIQNLITMDFKDLRLRPVYTFTEQF